MRTCALWITIGFCVANVGCGNNTNRVVEVEDTEDQKTAEELQKEAEEALPTAWEVPITIRRVAESLTECTHSTNLSALACITGLPKKHSQI